MVLILCASAAILLTSCLVYRHYAGINTVFDNVLSAGGPEEARLKLLDSLLEKYPDHKRSHEAVELRASLSSSLEEKKTIDQDLAGISKLIKSGAFDDAAGALTQMEQEYRTDRAVAQIRKMRQQLTETRIANHTQKVTDLIKKAESISDDSEKAAILEEAMNNYREASNMTQVNKLLTEIRTRKSDDHSRMKDSEIKAELQARQKAIDDKKKAAELAKICKTCGGKGRIACRTCDGNGSKSQTGSKACKTCGGSGKRKGVGDTLTTCLTCKGRGSLPDRNTSTCNTCRGTGFEPCPVCVRR